MTEYWGLASGFLFIMMLLTLSLFFSKIKWYFKAVLIVSTLCFVLYGHRSWVQSMGWPITDSLPSEMQFLWADVREPIANNPGQIIVWIIPNNQTDPRAIRIPYSRRNHQLVEQARQGAAGGVSVFLQSTEGSGNGTGNNQSQSNSDAATESDFIIVPERRIDKNR